MREADFLSLLLVTMSVKSVCGLFDYVCKENTESCGPIPPTLPSSFIAKMEVNFEEEHMSAIFEELYDVTEFKGVAIITGADVRSRYIYNYLEDLVVAVTESLYDSDLKACKATKLENSGQLFFGWNDRNGTTHHMPSAASVLHFGGNLKFAFDNYTVAREIPCLEWDACQKWDRANGTYSIHYYWSDSNKWQSEWDELPSVPVQMRMEGKYSPTGQESDGVDVRNTYEFISFQPNPDWAEYEWMFEIPGSLQCTGLKKTRSFPLELAYDYSIHREITMQLEDIADITDSSVNYEFFSEVVRMDGFPGVTSPEFSLFGFTYLEIVQDFSAGVEYGMDRNFGNCTVLPIPNITSGWEGHFAEVNKDGKLSMKDPSELFKQATNGTYVGQKHMRDILCDVWTGTATVKLDNGTAEEALTYEVYIMSEEWRKKNGISDVFVPIGLRIYERIDFDIELVDVDITVNYYRYSGRDPDFTRFDVSNCFLQDETKRTFQISFPGRFNPYLDRDPSKFVDQVRSSLRQAMELTATRLQQVQVDYSAGHNKIFCQFTVLGRPPIQGDAEYVHLGPSLSEAVSLLENAMDHLEVYIYTGHLTVAVPVDKGSLVEDYVSDPCIHPHSPDEHSVQEGPRQQPTGQQLQSSVSESPAQLKREYPYSPADVAVMAVGMLLLGLILGSSAVLLYLWRSHRNNPEALISMSERIH